MANPSTPHRPHIRRVLEPSPSFSVYFSDDDTTSPQAEHSMEPSPMQRNLLGRLQDIGQQILRKELSNHERSILDAELDALEQTLQAPEPQSREPADVEDSGLFMDEDDEYGQEDDNKQAGDLHDQVEEQIAQERKQRDELEARFEQIVKELQDRHEEVQHINRLAIAKIESTDQKLAQLHIENEHLRKDLAQTDNDLLYLKMQLRALEAQAYPLLNTPAGDALREGVERWKAEWKAISRQANRGTQRQDSAIDGLRIGSAQEETAHSIKNIGFLAPALPKKSRITITRPGLVAQHSSDPFVDYSPLANHNPSEPQGTGKEFAMTDSETSTSNVTAGKKGGDGEEDDREDEDETLAEDVISKTPWEELWESLAALTGMQGD